MDWRASVRDFRCRFLGRCFAFDEEKVREDRDPVADMLEASRAASEVVSLWMELLYWESSSRLRVRIMVDEAERAARRIR